MPRCKHQWLYEHTIYSDKPDGSGSCVHRQCSICGQHQIGKVRDFTQVLVGEDEKWNVPDLREEPTNE